MKTLSDVKPVRGAKRLETTDLLPCSSKVLVIRCHLLFGAKAGGSNKTTMLIQRSPWDLHWNQFVEGKMPSEEEKGPVQDLLSPPGTSDFL